jgi:DNA-directed RNA polymerase subunit RPC12/RpoP
MMAQKPAVKVYRQCPVCWSSAGGTGTESWWRRVNRRLVRRAYVCNHCKSRWVVKVRSITITSIESVKP